MNIGAEVDADPLLFGRATLQRKRWKAQRRIRRALEEHRQIAIRAAHGTGKTFELGSIVCEWMATVPYSRVVCGGPSHEAIKRGIWGEVRRAYFDCKRRGIDLGGMMGKESWIIDDGWDANIVSVENPNAAHGIHGYRVLVIIDEAQGVMDQSLYAAFKSLTLGDLDCTIHNGNPIAPEGHFYEVTKLPTWHCIQIDGYEHPNVRAPKDLNPDEITDDWVKAGRIVIPGSITRRFILDAKTEWGVDDPRYIARVRGEFPEAGARQLVSVGEIDAAWFYVTGKDRIMPAAPLNVRRIGLDVARFGGDRNVLHVIGEDMRVAHVESWTGEDLMATTGRLVNACRTFDVNPRMACVDVCGMGAGVVDRAREQGMRVRAVDFGSAAVGDWAGIVGKEAKYRNRKGELHEVVRNLIRSKQLGIGPEWRQTRADLVSLDFSFDGSGRFLVSDKEDMRRRIGRSPDFSDSLVIAFGTRTGADGIWVT